MIIARTFACIRSDVRKKNYDQNQLVEIFERKRTIIKLFKIKSKDIVATNITVCFDLFC